MKQHTGFLATLIFTILLSVLFNINKASCQTRDSLKNTLSFEWANNIWGNTFSIGYDYAFSKKIYGGISLGKGNAQFSFDDNGDSFFFTGAPGRKNNFKIDFKQMADLKIGFIFKDRTGLTLLNKFETGISYCYFNFKDQYVDDYMNLWKAGEDFTFYSLYLNLGIINYQPKENSHLDFCLGFKARVSVTGREELRYESPGKLPRYFYFVQNGNGFSVLPYPEFYVRINYSL